MLALMHLHLHLTEVGKSMVCMDHQACSEVSVPLNLTKKEGFLSLCLSISMAIYQTILTLSFRKPNR